MPAGVEHDRRGAHGFRHTAVVVEGVNEAADLEDRFAHRFALFLGQQGGQIFFLLQNRVSSRHQYRAAFGRRHGGPFLQSALRRVDGATNVGDGAFGNAVDNLPGRGIADFGGLSAFRIHLRAGD